MKNVIYNDKIFADTKISKILYLATRVLFYCFVLCYHVSMNYVVAMYDAKTITERVISGCDRVSKDVILKSLESDDDTNTNILSYLYSQTELTYDIMPVFNKIADSLDSADETRFIGLLSKAYHKEFACLRYILQHPDNDHRSKITDKICNLDDNNLYTLMSYTYSNQKSNLTYTMQYANTNNRINIEKRLCNINNEKFYQLMSMTDNCSEQLNLLLIMKNGHCDNRTMIAGKLCSLDDDKLYELYNNTPRRS